MNEAAVTISLEEYNQLRDRANVNEILFNKMVSYESRIMDLDKRMYELERKAIKS